MTFSYDSEVRRLKWADRKNATPPRQMWPASWSQSPPEGWESLLQREERQQNLPIHHDDLCPDRTAIETLASARGQRVPAGGNPRGQLPRPHRRLRLFLSNTICRRWPNS